MNGDITLEERCQWQSAAVVISPFIIFAVFDMSFLRYNFINKAAVRHFEFAKF